MQMYACSYALAFVSSAFLPVSISCIALLFCISAKSLYRHVLLTTEPACSHLIHAPTLPIIAGIVQLGIGFELDADVIDFDLRTT